MNLKPLCSALLAAAVAAGCNNAPPPETPPRVLADAPAGTPVVTVEGEVITEPLLAAYAEKRKLDLADPRQRQRALDGLIDGFVLARDALAGPVAKTPEVKAELAVARLDLLAENNVEAFRAAAPITDEQLRAFYDEEAERTGHIELSLKHILFADEPSARAALELAKAPGADFDALIEGYATTARQAKDLGWANLSQLPAELALAAKALQDGEVAPQPVQTQFGWHVVKRIASRPFTPPPFEQIREGAKVQLGDQLLRERIKALREQASIVLPGGEAGK